VEFQNERITMTYKVFTAAVFIASLIAACGANTNQPDVAAGNNVRMRTVAADTNDQRTPNMANVMNNEPNPSGSTAPKPPNITDVRLEAKIKVDDDKITIKYTVTNNSSQDIYVLDAYPAAKDRQPYVDQDAFYLCSRGSNTAFILKGVPPLPADKTVVVRLMPLGPKLESKQSVERDLVLPLPLRERSDWYYTPLPPEEYSMGSVEKIVFDVQYLRSNVDGFKAEPAQYNDKYFFVKGSNTPKQAESVEVEFPIAKTQLFIRKDMFSRI
jgi:hypothetical protein